MRVGINGMGRMGRLALRAAFGAIPRAEGDPRAANRLDVVHVNEIKGGAAATAHLLEFDSIHGRWRTPFEVDGERAISVGGKAHRLFGRALAGRGTVGRSWLRHSSRMHRQVSETRTAAGLFRPWRATRHRRRACEGCRRAQHRRWRQRSPLRSGAPQADHCSVVHDQLPRPCRQSGAREHRHPPRTDHDDPRSDQHQRRRRCPAQGPAPGALGHALSAAHDNRQRDGDCAHLSRAQGQAQRPRRPGARAQRQPHRLRVRAEAGDHRGRGERAVCRRRAYRTSPGFSDTRRGPWSRPTTTTTREAPSSTVRAPW